MNVRVRFFATYRSVTGVREVQVEVPSGARLQDLLARLLQTYPGLADHEATMLLAVNQEFAEPAATLQPGDEVALLPPVSGGRDPFCRVQTASIAPSALLDLVHDPRAGAVVLFLGTVRADPGVNALEYEVYSEMAVKQLDRLRADAKTRFAVTEMAIVHRTGRLSLGETSVAVACSAPHRHEAFRACEWAMDELKRIVPIWKTDREDP